MNNDIKTKFENLTDVEQIKMIKKDPTLLKYVSNDFQRIYPGVVLDAVKINKEVLEFVIPELKDFIEVSVNNETNNIQISVNNDDNNLPKEYTVVKAPALKDGKQTIPMVTEETKTEEPKTR